VRDAFRLAFGTLTILPVRPPDKVDRRTAGRAMALAPLVGLVLAAVAGLVLLLEDRSPLLASTLAVAVLALLTRGIHLDGLADTADGLGSGRPGEQGLAVMRMSDIGPFGVVTLVLALLLQVSALASSTSRGDGVQALATALVVSRLVIPLLCTPMVRPARADGLGSVVAGSVRGSGIAATVLLSVVAVALVALLAPAEPVRWAALVDAEPLSSSPDLVVVALTFTLPLLAAGLLGWRCVRRFGGITGDVLGACVEVGFTTALVVACL
jgi:adenosylcobinamide-GDP ribazoletransferase